MASIVTHKSLHQKAGRFWGQREPFSCRTFQTHPSCWTSEQDLCICAQRSRTPVALGCAMCRSMPFIADILT